MMKNSTSEKTLRFDPAIALHDRAIAILLKALNEQPKFVKVHAAESLLDLGYKQEVLAVFERELAEFGGEPSYRIGIRRVLARASGNDDLVTGYVEFLCHAFLDPNAKDAAGAAESLAKLKYRIKPTERTKYEESAKKLSETEMPFALWLLAISGGDTELSKLADLLDAKQPLVRGVAAYALRHLRDRLPHAVAARIGIIAEQEPEGIGRAYLIGAGYVTAEKPQQLSRFQEQLIHYLKVGNTDQKYEAASALAIRGDDHDLPLLATLLDDPEPDVCVSAANATLQIHHRSMISKRQIREQQFRQGVST